MLRPRSNSGCTRTRLSFCIPWQSKATASAASQPADVFSDRHCDMAEARDIDPEELDIEAMTNLADACPTTGTRSMKQELTMVVRRFTKHLIDAGAMARSDPSPSPSGSVDQLCMELDHWLRSQRGMYGPRLQRYPKLLTHFVGHCCNDTGTLQNLSSVTPEDVLAFVDRITGPGN